MRIYMARSAHWRSLNQFFDKLIPGHAISQGPDRLGVGHLWRTFAQNMTQDMTIREQSASFFHPGTAPAFGINFLTWKQRTRSPRTTGFTGIVLAVIAHVSGAAASRRGAGIMRVLERLGRWIVFTKVRQVFGTGG